MREERNGLDQLALPVLPHPHCAIMQHPSCPSKLSRTTLSVVAGDETFDVVVIGAGIVGLATARALLVKRPKLRLAVIEKEPLPGTHQTGHNSGVLHSGHLLQAGLVEGSTLHRGEAEARAVRNGTGDPVRRVREADRRARPDRASSPRRAAPARRRKRRRRPTRPGRRRAARGRAARGGLACAARTAHGDHRLRRGDARLRPGRRGSRRADPDRSRGPGVRAERP